MFLFELCLLALHHGCVYCQDAASYSQQSGVPACSQRGHQEGLPHGGHGLLLHDVLHRGENAAMALFRYHGLKMCCLVVMFACSKSLNMREAENIDVSSLDQKITLTPYHFKNCFHFMFLHLLFNLPALNLISVSKKVVKNLHNQR